MQLKKENFRNIAELISLNLYLQLTLEQQVWNVEFSYIDKYTRIL